MATLWGMVRSIKALQEASDEELIADHDRHAPSTSVGTQYYLDELNRRAQERAAEAADQLARRVYRLTIANTVVAVIAAVAAVAAVVVAVIALAKP